MNKFFKKIMGDDDYENETAEQPVGEFEDPAPETTAAASETPVSGKPKAQFILVKPERRDELLSIADHLIAKRSVILNLELVTKDSRRFVDFLSGVAYGQNGRVKKVADNTYLIIPGGLEITGDIFEDLEQDLRI